MLCFKSLRANAADVAVAPGSIVERLDVFGDIFGRSVSIVVDVLLDSLLLQTAEEGLRHRVVPAVPSTAHAGLEMIGLAEPAPRVTSVLRALIRVDQCSARPLSTHSHQGGIEHELAIDGRASRPTDDSSRVQIQDHRQIQPALPGADIRDICDLNDIRLANLNTPRAVAVQGTKTILAHEAFDPVLAARFAGFAKVEKDARSAVDAVTGNKGRSNEPQQPGVLSCAIGKRVLEPFVVAARRNLEHLAKRSNWVLSPMGLNELVRFTNLPGTHSLGHRSLPGPLDYPFSCVHKILGTPRRLKRKT